MWTYTIRVVPKGMRFHIDELGNRLTITLLRSSTAWVLLIPLWGVLIFYLGRASWLPLLEGKRDNLVFMLFWVGFILVWIGMALWGSIKSVFGTRQLTFTPEELAFTITVAGIGRTRRWPLAHLEHFQYVHPIRRRREKMPGGLAFNAQGKLIRIEGDLTEAEVAQILAFVRRWAAAYAPAEAAKL